jgi:DNA-binding MarR family transcriptional regulator
MSRDPDQPERFLTDRMRQIDAAVTARITWILRRHGVEGVRISHGRLMADLGGGARPTELARRLGVTKAAVGQLLAHLEAHGYVESATDPADRRARIIRPTAKARAAYRVARRELDAIEAEWEVLLGQDRMNQLRESLAILEVWRAGSAAGISSEDVDSLNS